MEERYQHRCEELIQRMREQSGAANEELLRLALAFAYEASADQLYISGDPYFEHCLNIAEILLDLKMDHETVIAGLLHSIGRDQEAKFENVREQFGTNIHDLVFGFYQISELKLKEEEIKQKDVLRKLILSIARDIRVIIIKFADQLEKMRALNINLEQHNETLIRHIAQESMAIYAPLAHRLGVSRIKETLEDLSFRFLDRDKYANIKARVTESREEQERYLNQIVSELQSGLREVGVEAEIKGRPKSIYSIHRKMVNRGYSFDKINDILAIRIIVKEGSEKVNRYQDCYTALSVVQNLFKPIQALYTDYIQNPRENGYQSIHTKVIYHSDQDGHVVEKIVEVQIRTDKMHEKAETGVAAHWLYKERRLKKDEIDERLSAVRQKVLDDAMNPDEFIKSLRIDDLFEDKIFVFSPDRDLWQLGIGSTPVDFAFHVHTDIGLHCIGAKVNGKLVPLDTALKSGDAVEIITSKNQQPNQDWLKFVKTSRARNKIKKWFRDSRFEQSIKWGEELLHKAFKNYRVEITSDKLKEIATSHNFSTVDKLYAAIGLGEITPDSIIRKIAPDNFEQAKRENLFKKIIKRARGGDRIVRVQGLDNLLISFARCCQPLPGDRITGFITKGRGVVIHRTDCKNVHKLLELTDRNIEVQWAKDFSKSFIVRLTMIAENNRVFLRDVTESMAVMNINIVSVDMKAKEMFVRNIMALEVVNLDHLNQIIHKIRSIKGIISVERMQGNGKFTKS